MKRKLIAFVLLACLVLTSCQPVSPQTDVTQSAGATQTAPQTLDWKDSLSERNRKLLVEHDRTIRDVLSALLKEEAELEARNIESKKPLIKKLLELVYLSTDDVSVLSKPLFVYDAAGEPYVKLLGYSFYRPALIEALISDVMPFFENELFAPPSSPSPGNPDRDPYFRHKKMYRLMNILLSEIPEYRFERMEELKQYIAAIPQREWKDLTFMDSVYFGNYYQYNDKELQPILWQVIAKQDDRLTLMSTVPLEFLPWENDPQSSQAFHWENSDLRAFLNESFYQIAFSEEEKQRILPTKLINEWIEDEMKDAWGIPVSGYGWGGADTVDNVYLYSFYDYYHAYSTWEKDPKPLLCRLYPSSDYFTKYTYSKASLAGHDSYETSGYYRERWTESREGDPENDRAEFFRTGLERLALPAAVYPVITVSIA